MFACIRIFQPLLENIWILVDVDNETILVSVNNVIYNIPFYLITASVALSAPDHSILMIDFL